MSNRPSKKRSSSARVQAAVQRRPERQPGLDHRHLVALVVVGVVIIVAIASSNNGGGSDNITGRKTAPAALVTKVTTMPDQRHHQPSAPARRWALPKPINGKPIEHERQAGHPLHRRRVLPVLRHRAMGHGQRPVAVRHLHQPEDHQLVDHRRRPRAPRRSSFYKADYTSDYIHFTGVETEDNTKGKLETPTAASSDPGHRRRPYNPQQGSIPFIYFNGEYLISGATFDVGVLQGKTWDQIATAMNDPSSAIAKGAIGAANGITATICLTTGNQPANVCSLPVIKSLQTQIKAQSSSSSSSDRQLQHAQPLT